MNHLTRNTITRLSSQAALVGAFAFAFALLCSLCAPAGASPTLTTLYSFPALSTTKPYGNTTGAYPADALVQGADGDFYGTASDGGTNGTGTVFKITPSGILTAIYNFSAENGQGYNAEGISPTAGLTLGSDGDFYGTTISGGAFADGTIFKVTPAGILTDIDAFTGTSGFNIGAAPYDTLVEGSDGDFYGPTYFGGASNTGTIFKVTPTGVLTTLHSFSALSGSQYNSDGAYPYASLVQDNDGDFYGTTYQGGGNAGTLFKITSEGSLTTLLDFGGDGRNPMAGLDLGSDGNLYGTTTDTVFKVAASGAVTVLAALTAATGINPLGALVQGSDGNFYGTTSGGGTLSKGTVFEVTPSGTLTTLVNFSGADGQQCEAGLVQGSDGSLYGTTAFGGANNTGTVFKLSFSSAASPATIASISPSTLQAGNLPFVLTVVGAGFSKGVTLDFDGTALTPSFAASTKLTFNVPAGLVATPGALTVAVIDPGYDASNALPFTVTPGLTLTGISQIPSSIPSQPVSITVTGTNLVNGCVVKWNKMPLLTYYLSPTQATATVPASLLATPGVVDITISNPHVFATAAFTFTIAAQ